MKFTINSKVLLGKLTGCSKAMSKKQPIVILDYFKMTLAEDGELTIKASDTSQGVTATIHIDNYEGEGSVCIEAQRILNLLKATPNAPITIEVNEETGQATLRHSNGRYSLPSQGVAEYPDFEKANPDEVKMSLKISASILKEALDNVGFAVAEDNLRPMLNGVFLDAKPGSVTFVASDTAVLARCKFADESILTDGSVIIPRWSLPLLKDFLLKGDGEILVEVTDKAIYIQGEDYFIRTKTVQGRYPDYNRVIPSTHNISLSTDTQILSSAINRVGICGEFSDALEINVEDSRLRLVIKTGDKVEGEEAVSCDSNGESIRIGFNSLKLSGLLGVIKSDEVDIKIVDERSPVTFEPRELSGKGELTIICMPLNIA